jgi:hypothetical protein
MNDTPSPIESRYRHLIMALSPSKRMAMAAEMFDTAQKLARAGILTKKPNQTKAELRTRLFLRFYGADFSQAELNKIIANIPDMDLKMLKEGSL